jgi:hypothetical protein
MFANDGKDIAIYLNGLLVYARRERWVEALGKAFCN